MLLSGPGRGVLEVSGQMGYKINSLSRLPQIIASPVAQLPLSFRGQGAGKASFYWFIWQYSSVVQSKCLIMSLAQTGPSISCLVAMFLLVDIDECHPFTLLWVVHHPLTFSGSENSFEGIILSSWIYIRGILNHSHSFSSQGSDQGRLMAIDLFKHSDIKTGNARWFILSSGDTQTKYCCWEWLPLLEGKDWMFPHRNIG